MRGAYSAEEAGWINNLSVSHTLIFWTGYWRVKTTVQCILSNFLLCQHGHGLWS